MSVHVKARHRDLVGKTIGLLVIVMLVYALIAWTFEQARRPGFLSLGVEECRAEYRHALTSADSARVDARIPATGGQKGWTAQTCGLLRRSGSLR